MECLHGHTFSFESFFKHRGIKLVWCVMILCIASLAFGDDTIKDVDLSADGEPAYRVLYENGFYDQAIDYLTAKINKSPDSVGTEEYRYLAFSYVATERIDSARGIFVEMLTKDSAFKLDPVRTSPKIYQVFRAAQIQWRKLHQPPHQTNPPAGMTPAQSHDTLPKTAVSLSVNTLQNQQLPLSRWYKIPVYLAPGGTAQFCNGETVKGTIVLCLQVLSLGGSIYAFEKKQDFYDDRFGWYEGNQTQFGRYSLASRIGFGSFACTYLWSVFDSFAHNK